MSVTIKAAVSGAKCELKCELNVANGNFSTFWSALGLDLQEFCGEMRPHAIADVLRSFDDALLVRAGRRDGNFIECGLSAEQGARYLSSLRAIVDEALRSETSVIWF